MSNSISGKASAGALITLSGVSSATTYADPLGAYSFSGLAAGAYVVTPTATSLKFTPATQNVTIVSTDFTGVNFLATSLNSAGSNTTLRDIIDHSVTFADIQPIFNVAGYEIEPARTIGDDVFTAICAVNFPHKWNRVNLPQFYTFSWQQDYALLNPDGTSVYNVEWLEQGMALNINNQNIPKKYTRVECGRSLPQRTGGYYNNNACGLGDPGFVVSSLPNKELYYGVWGQPNIGSPTMGNNPVAGSVYTNPVGNYSQPSNPINQIVDANGNLLVLTTYGTEGSAAPLLPVNTTPGTTVSGTGASTVWTVVDPNGLGIRLNEIPSQTGSVWQFNLVGQMPPVKFTNLQQTLAPLPDKYTSFFRAGFVAQCYRYSPLEKTRMKFKEEWTLWLKSLQGLREVQDRELEEYNFITQRTITGSGRGGVGYVGAANPFNYPR